MSAWLCAAPASAQSSEVSGNWRAGATAIDVAIESWGGDCGPRPQSTKSNGGGLVTVEQKDQVLLLHGRDQDIRTDNCWSRNPAMKRTVASVSNGQWITRCRTSDNDPRAEQGTYTLKLSDANTLFYQDVSRYDWSLNESKCVATFTTSQTLTRAGGKSAPVRIAKPENTTPTRTPAPAPQRVDPPEVTPPPTAATPADSRPCTPGAPSKLVLRPRRAEIELGQRACIRARVADAADCTVPNPQVDWSLSHSRALRGTLVNGCFTAADTAAEAQGEFHITAKAAGLQAEALVVVRRIDLSALIATRMEGGGLTGFDEQEQVDIAPKAVARIATHTTTDDLISPARRYLMVALGATAVALMLLGLLISRRRAAAVGGGTESTLPPSNAAAALPRSGAPAGHDASVWICPTCRVGYPAHQTTCPKDGTPLIPYAEFMQRQKREDLEHSKRCPKCGKAYPASASFCGDDGSNLVNV